jgi:hypothetical protein
MQVIRALHDRAIDSKTATLTLYALQVASGNLKRFTAEQSPASNPAQEASFLESLVKILGLPETPEEIMAEMSAQSNPSLRNSSPWPPIGAATITKSPASEE